MLACIDCSSENFIWLSLAFMNSNDPLIHVLEEYYLTNSGNEIMTIEILCEERTRTKGASMYYSSMEPEFPRDHLIKNWHQKYTKKITLNRFKMYYFFLYFLLFKFRIEIGDILDYKYDNYEFVEALVVAVTDKSVSIRPIGILILNILYIYIYIYILHSKSR